MNSKLTGWGKHHELFIFCHGTMVPGFFIGLGLGDTFARSLLFNKSGLFSCPYKILDYFSDILFTFLTTFVLITKLKSLSVFLSVCLSICQSVCLSVGLSFYVSIFLTSL